MTKKENPLAASGARFCGEMNASISHEIKNVMAVINENAGLLEDMVALHRLGKPFDDARIEKLAQSVTRQIARANDIIAVMNRFAHSADHEWGPVDVGETVQFMLELTSRLIMLKGIRFDAVLPDKTVTAFTSRFYLQFAIWQCLQAAMHAGRSDRAVQIRVDKTETGPALQFSGLDTAEAFPESVLASIESSCALELIGARMVSHPEAGAFYLELPGKGS